MFLSCSLYGGKSQTSEFCIYDLQKTRKSAIIDMVIAPE